MDKVFALNYIKSDKKKKKICNKRTCYLVLAVIITSAILMAIIVY